MGFQVSLRGAAAVRGPSWHEANGHKEPIGRFQRHREALNTESARVIIYSYGLRPMSSGDGRSRLNFISVCSASTKHSAQSSQIRSFKSLSLQHKTDISAQTGQKSAYSETKG